MAQTRRRLTRAILLPIGIATLCFLTGGATAADTALPELLLPLGHGFPVESVAVSADAECVLTGVDAAMLWDAKSGKTLQTFKQEGPVISVALSADGKRALTGSADKTAVLWDAENGKPLQTFKGHTDEVTSVALSADGRRVLTGSKDGTAVLWDADTGKPLQTFKHDDPVRSVALSADAKRLLTAAEPNPSLFGRPRSDHEAILWDAESGKPLQTFRGHKDSVAAVALSANGRRVLTGSKDGTAKLWDADSGNTIQTFENYSYFSKVALSADGKRVLVSFRDKTAKLWDADSGKPLQTFKGHADEVTSVALSADGRRVVTGSADKTAMLWDAASGEPLQTFKGRVAVVCSLSVTEDGRRVATVCEHKATLWDAASGRPLQTFKGHANAVTSVALSADGKRVLTGSRDKTAILWDADSGKPLQTFKGHADAVTCVAMSGDGRRVLTGSMDHTAVLWNAETGKQLQSFKGDPSYASSVALSADGRRVLTGLVDGNAVLWGSESGKALQTFKLDGTILSVALSTDGRRVLAGSSINLFGGFNDHKAVLWDADSGKPLQTFPGGTGVASVALSADGKRILTGGFDLTAKLWDVDTGKPLHTFRGHISLILGVSFADRDSLVATAGADGTVRFWKPGREEPVFSFLSSGDDWLFWTPEGYYTCSPNGENLIAWKVKDDSPQGYRIVGPEQFRKKFYRPDLFRHLLDEMDLGKALALADKESGHAPETPSDFAKELPPSAIIAKPLKSGEIIKGEECEVAVKATPNGDNFVTSLQLLVDGRPYPGARASFSPKAEDATATWKVDLPVGKCRLRVVAESVKGSTSQSNEVEITREGETQPQLLLLGVGVSEYDKIDRNGTEAAADSVNRFLDAQLQYGKTLFLDPMRIPLVDQQKQPLPAGKATKAAVLDAFDELARQAQEAWKAGKHPVSVIILAGHGELSQEGTAYFLVTDSDRQRLRATAISEGELKEALRAIPGRVVLFLDACHAGAFADKLYRELTDARLPRADDLLLRCGREVGGKPLAESRPFHGGGH